MKVAVAIALKIPDNAAYTAAVALRRLGLAVGRVERSEIWFFDDGGDSRALLESVEADETIFNPNKHVATILARPAPRAGEVWIESLEDVARPERSDQGRRDRVAAARRARYAARCRRLARRGRAASLQPRDRTRSILTP